MGIWEVVNSGTDTVKRNVAGFNTALFACKTSYYYGAAAVTKVDKVIRVDGIQRISSYMRDEKSRAQIGLFASKLVQNTAQYAVKEGFKMLPGGKAVADIVDKTVHDTRLANQTSFQGKVAKVEIISGNGESERSTTKSNTVVVIEEKQSKAMQIISEKSDLLEVTEKQGEEGGKAVVSIPDKTVHDTKLANQTSLQGNVAKKVIISGKGESERCTTKRDMVEVMENQGRAKEIISEKRKMLEVTEKVGKEGMQMISENHIVPYPCVHKKPEDVLRVFMMKDFIGSRILDDLLVPQSRRGKGC